MGVGDTYSMLQALHIARPETRGMTLLLGILARQATSLA